MDTLVIYAPNTSNRLNFVLEWLFKERLHLAYRLTNNEQEAARESLLIAYGKALPGSISIPDNGLLWQKGISSHDVKPWTWNDLPVIYSVDNQDFTLPFDLFSALFFLLSRYEEYYPYKPDKHERYPAQASVLYKNGWLQRPLVDEWVAAFRVLLQAKMGIKIEPSQFLFLPTYDIDMAYSYLHKGAIRMVGAYLRAFLKFDFRQINERTDVLKRKQKDPYDSFRWLRQLHKEYGFKPTYFILSALAPGKFDKNIHPEHPAMVRVIKNLAKEGAVGIHPSYYSGQGYTMSKEKGVLEQVAGRKTEISRQHYIRHKAPDTWRLLIKNGINHDYSMGYGAHLGFRAGTGSSFKWYDIENEAITSLRLHPFCFMDSTAHYEGKLSATDAFAKLDEMSKKLERCGGVLVTVFHNFILGTDYEFRGWRHGYENFMHEKSKLL